MNKLIITILILAIPQMSMASDDVYINGQWLDSRKARIEEKNTDFYLKSVRNRGRNFIIILKSKNKGIATCTVFDRHGKAINRREWMISNRTTEVKLYAPNGRSAYCSFINL